MASGVACADRATSELLIGPDWAINMELCDIINMDPGQAKDVIKILKKRLGSKNSKIQILTLFVLETLSKNCGDSVHLQIVERDILHEMVKIVKKKSDLHVREKILSLIDAWQEAFGGSGGKYPQYYAAYQELRTAGVEFPPREEISVPLFTPPQTHPIVQPRVSPYEDVAIEASLQSDVAALSLADIQNAHGITDVLMEMLNALEPNNSEGLKQEVIVDLVEQCHSFQNRVMSLVNNTGDEQLLFSGLALNDNLQRVLQRYDDLLKGKQPAGSTELATAPLVRVDAEDDESEDDFSQLAHRSSRENATGRPVTKNEPAAYHSPLLPPPPPSMRPVNMEGSTVDYLSGDNYRAEKSTSANVNTQPPTASESTPPAAFYSLPRYDKPAQTESSTEHLPSAPWEVNPTSPLPPPPSKHDQRQQFFKHNQSGNPASSQDGLIEHTQNISLHEAKSAPLRSESTPPARLAKPEDALFKDLVDFAKAKTPSASKPGSKRTY
ncbi:unnamed protein product [Spirodela intermedia]|uniref:Uncharacterized protein n=1 Tax=Spirodela intermedia TaxID=51605 RepID=A0A7I8JC52_SPIIN|nr:unnamed protein product [Spirodela intermedia]CAA6667714.1 unnamed protein product [Spirodela intermedia]